MNLFIKKCEHCKKKIGKGEGIFRNVKGLIFIEKRQKLFCCEEHADNYEKEVKEYIENCPKSGGCCWNN